MFGVVVGGGLKDTPLLCIYFALGLWHHSSLQTWAAQYIRESGCINKQCDGAALT